MLKSDFIWLTNLSWALQCIHECISCITW